MSDLTEREWRIPNLRLVGSRVVVVALLAAVPLFVSDYQSGLVVEFLILALFAASYDLLIGYAGIVSFGHALPYGVGLYGFAIFATSRPIPYIPTEAVPVFGAFVVGLLITALVSLGVGYVALQATGVYFAMITLALAQIGYIIVFETTSISGGSEGILLFAQEVFGISLGDPTTFYYVTLGLVVICFLSMKRLTTSPYGQVLQSIRENETRSRFLGYDTFRYKLSVFTVAGVYAGVAGILSGLHQSIATPDALYWSTGGDALLMTLIGGMGTLWGPGLGAAVLFGAREFLTGITDQWQIVLGSVFVIFVIFVPNGLAGIFTGNRGRSVWDVISDLKP
jgi:branched-chain amino acid transport system permease protein